VKTAKSQQEWARPQHLKRPWGIGGSDIGAIVGLSPYKSAVDVWAEKVTGAGANDCEGIHLRYGQHLEPFVAQEYERVSGNLTHELPKTLRHKTYAHLFAHVDRLVSVKGAPVIDERGRVCTTTILECKTASAFSSDQWGQAWTDEVPAAYLAQCVWYTTITGSKEAHIAVLLGNSDFRVYRVSHDEELGQSLIDAALNFWDRYVLTGVPPEARTRAEVLRLYPKEISGSEVEACSQTLSQLKKLSRIQRLTKSLEARADLIKDQLTVSMGGAERLCAQGKTLATWRSSAPTQRVDVTRLRRDRPDIVREYVVETAATRRLVLAGPSSLKLNNREAAND
jgi:putative phage-type endonuclease